MGRSRVTMWIVGVINLPSPPAQGHYIRLALDGTLDENGKALTREIEKGKRS